MKAVLLSIKPKYCELIASGEKTVEIRKNCPKIDVPFKCYMYQTKHNWIYKILEWLKLYQGKVIGEFVCDKITFLGNITTDEWKYLVGDTHECHKKIVVENACLSEAEVLKYGNSKSCDAWHISDLVIYDEPKELGEFRKWGFECLWDFIRMNKCRDYDGIKCTDCCFTRPPQSWCYVEELEVSKK